MNISYLDDARNSITNKLTIKRRPYILNGTIQPVYKYYLDGVLVLTYYTNGKNTNLYPVYHKLETWPKEKLDVILARYLPHG